MDRCAGTYKGTQASTNLSSSCRQQTSAGFSYHNLMLLFSLPLLSVNRHITLSNFSSHVTVISFNFLHWNLSYGSKNTIIVLPALLAARASAEITRTTGIAALSIRPSWPQLHIRHTDFWKECLWSLWGGGSGTAFVYPTCFQPKLAVLIKTSGNLKHTGSQQFPYTPWQRRIHSLIAAQMVQKTQNGHDIPVFLTFDWL